MKKRVTIKDIAHNLNMHHSTVSRALRNDVRVKEETRKKIVDYAEECGYQVNMNALQLRGSMKNTLALIVPNVNHNFFSNIVSIITNLAVEQGFILSIFQSNESYVQEKEIIDTIIRNNVAGVIASVTMETKNSDHFKKLHKFKIPLVLFDRFCNDIHVPKVMVNNEEVVFRAVELLINKGCRRIAHIGGPQSVNVFKDRQNGYLKALNAFEINYQQSYFIEKGFTIEDGKLTMVKLLNLFKRPDGLIVDSNNLLTGVLLELKKLKFRIPEDIIVIGFNNNPYLEAFSPGVISIVQPEKDIAHYAFELLLKQLENSKPELVENIVVTSEIVEEFIF